MPQEPYVFPWKVTVTPNPLGCGQSAIIRIEGTPGGTAPTAIPFTLSCTPSTFFTNLPSGGTLPQGQNVVEIPVTRSTISFRSGATLSVDSASGHADTVVQPLPNDHNCDEE